jgi:O-antigen ligase
MFEKFKDLARQGYIDLTSLDSGKTRRSVLGGGTAALSVCSVGTVYAAGDIGNSIMLLVTDVFAQISVFAAAAIILACVVYALASVFASDPRPWRQKIVYAIIVLICFLCLGTIYSFITKNFSGQGSPIFNMGNAGKLGA